jgi:hypothetical protein
MALNKIKPIVEEFEGVRCIVVESGITAERADFLTKLLSHNGYEVKKTTTPENAINLGVTDLLFNPVLDVYKRRLKSLSGKRVTAAYWMQQTDAETEKEVNYWKK